MSRPTDLYAEARQQLLEVVRSIRSANQGSKFVMVIDEATAAVLACFIRTTELIDMDIVLLEKYEIVRKPLHMYQAIYVLGPNTPLATFLDDWNDPEKPRYRGAHLVFTYPPNPDVLAPIRARPHVISRLATCKSLFLSFVPVDPQTFHSRCAPALNSLYGMHPKLNWDICLTSSIVPSLVSACLALKIIPSICYVRSDKLQSDILDGLSGMLQRELDANFGRWPQADRGNFVRSGAVLLLVPRSADQISPLMHAISYEAFSRDFCEIKNDVLEMPGKTEPVQVSFDALRSQEFANYRYMAYPDVSTPLQEFSRQMTELEGKTKAGGPETQRFLLELQMNQVRIDETNARLEALSKAIETARARKALRSTRADNPIPETVLELEQALVTGLNPFVDGEKFNVREDMVFSAIDGTGPRPIDKARMLCCWQLCGKSPMDDGKLRRASDSQRLGEWIEGVRNLQRLGAQFPRKKEQILIEGSQAADDLYNPFVVDLVTAAVDGKLPKEIVGADRVGGRAKDVIIYFLGGVSYFELRHVQRLRAKLKGVRIYIGGSSILTADSYLEGLKGLSD